MHLTMWNMCLQTAKSDTFSQGRLIYAGGIWTQGSPPRHALKLNRRPGTIKLCQHVCKHLPRRQPQRVIRGKHPVKVIA